MLKRIRPSHDAHGYSCCPDCRTIQVVSHGHAPGCIFENKSQEEIDSIDFDEYVTVQFCPSGEVQQRTNQWIIEHGGMRQLDMIKNGIKLDAPIFHDDDMDSL